VDLASTLAFPPGALIHVVHGAVLVLFVISALLLTLVILVQEGKGGGLAGAFGGAGAEAFGVKAGTVNRFTAWLAAAFLGLALLHAGMTTHIAQADKAPGGGPSIEEFRGTGSGDSGAKDGSGTSEGSPGGGAAGEATAPGEEPPKEEPPKEEPPKEEPPKEGAPGGTDSSGGGGN